MPLESYSTLQAMHSERILIFEPETSKLRKGGVGAYGNAMVAIRRRYNNVLVDSDKQQQIEMFLGMKSGVYFPTAQVYYKVCKRLRAGRWGRGRVSQGSTVRKWCHAFSLFHNDNESHTDQEGSIPAETNIHAVETTKREMSWLMLAPPRQQDTISFSTPTGSKDLAASRVDLHSSSRYSLVLPQHDPFPHTTSCSTPQDDPSVPLDFPESDEDLDCVGRLDWPVPEKGGRDALAKTSRASYNDIQALTNGESSTGGSSHANGVPARWAEW